MVNVVNTQAPQLSYTAPIASDKTKTEQSQLSLGYEYAFNTNVAGTFTGSMLTIEDKSATDPEKKNDATVLTTGLRVTF